MVAIALTRDSCSERCLNQLLCNFTVLNTRAFSDASPVQLDGLRYASRCHQVSLRWFFVAQSQAQLSAGLETDLDHSSVFVLNVIKSANTGHFHS